MEILSIDDLMSGNVSRSMAITVPGAGRFEVKELNSAEAERVQKESVKVPVKDEGANADFVAYWVYRLLTGKYPEGDECAVLRAKNSPGVLLSIYKQGLAFNLLSDESREAIEKNS